MAEETIQQEILRMATELEASRTRCINELDSFIKSCREAWSRIGKKIVIEPNKTIRGLEVERRPKGMLFLLEDGRFAEVTETGPALLELEDVDDAYSASKIMKSIRDSIAAKIKASHAEEEAIATFKQNRS